MFHVERKKGIDYRRKANWCGDFVKKRIKGTSAFR
jgi:hypothetical protein